MKAKLVETPGATAAKQSADMAKRREYQPPQLLKLGDVRDLTLGASQGVPESGGSPGSLLP